MVFFDIKKSPSFIHLIITAVRIILYMLARLPRNAIVKINMIAKRSDILDMLNWGVRISFSGYRNRLRNEPTIRFTKNRYEVIK